MLTLRLSLFIISWWHNAHDHLSYFPLTQYILTYALPLPANIAISSTIFDIQMPGMDPPRGPSVKLQSSVRYTITPLETLDAQNSHISKKDTFYTASSTT